MTDTPLNNEKIKIDDTLVRRLVATQFPQWKNLTIWQVKSSGWDNRTFHLGNHMLIRPDRILELAAATF